jgi:hypothetical protein
MARNDAGSNRSLFHRWADILRGPRPEPAQVPVHPDVRFEFSDINPRGVVIAGFAVLAGIWIVIFLVYFVFTGLARYRAAAGPAPLPIAVQRDRLPPLPRIQTSPTEEDLNKLRAYEDARLNSYDWVDRKAGTVRIPIDRAMQLLVSRGLPPQKAPPDLKLSIPQAGTRETGFEGKVEPEPR